MRVARKTCQCRAIDQLVQGKGGAAGRGRPGQGSAANFSRNPAIYSPVSGAWIRLRVHCTARDEALHEDSQFTTIHTTTSTLYLRPETNFS